MLVFYLPQTKSFRLTISNLHKSSKINLHSHKKDLYVCTSYKTTMEIKYYIQDVKTKEYFWSYRIDEGFTPDVSSARSFDSESEAVDRLKEEYLQDLFADRVFEIKKYILK